MQPLVSVIIPTHNRPECAVSTIRAVLAASEQLEVVVSDTSPEDRISQAFAGEQFPRLKLLRPGRPLSVVDNFNLALSEASGEFLVFIGDDDLVAPQIAEVAHWAKAQSVDAIAFSFPALYYWPSFVSTTRWNAAGSTLTLNEFTGQVAPFDAKATLTHALGNLGAGVLDMPRVYAGMVARKLVDRIIAKHGALFGGVSPDIYSAALIAMECSKSYRVDFPVVIPGACGGSTSGHSARGKHVGRLRDNAHIGAFKQLVWDTRVPEYYSVPTVWGFSLLKAVEDKSTWLCHVNFSRLYLKCLISDPHYAGTVLGCLRLQFRERGVLRAGAELFLALAGECLRVARIVTKRLLRPSAPGRVETVSGIVDTEQALRVLLVHLAKPRNQLRLTDITR